MANSSGSMENTISENGKMETDMEAVFGLILTEIVTTDSG